jgi:hypothetical protein
MSKYSLIGILRCPYRKVCGPDSENADYEFELEAAERHCLTRKHFGCAIYRSKRLEERKKALAATGRAQQILK